MSAKYKPVSKRASFGVLLAISLSLLLVTGCASIPRTDDQKVTERSQARWDALIGGDLETAYTYYSPGYRSANSLIDFGVAMRMRKVQWISATVTGAECEESRCTVKSDIGYRVYGAVPGVKVWETTNQVEESWVKTGGEWWFLAEK